MDFAAAVPTDPAIEPPSGRALPGAPRAVRHLVPPEVPWVGSLATLDQASCFLVDARLLREWAGWDADPDGHVLAPLDVVRRTDGHDVVLPLCTERLVRFLQRRAGRGVPLSAGETITVLVSILRGTAEAVARSPFAAGEWWLTDSGRPVFVHGEGPDAVMAADVCLAAVGEGVPETAEIRARLGAGIGTGHGSAAADLAHPRALAAALPEIEAVLFARHDPEPLATTDLAPARARLIGAVPDPDDDILAHSGRSRPRLLSRFVDSDLREVVAAGWDAVRENRRRRVRARNGDGDTKRSRRGLIAVAGAVGAAVVVGGLLWPSSDPVSASGSTPTSHPSASARESSQSTPDRTEAATSHVPAETVTRIRAMLAARIACGHDDACRGSFAEDPGRPVPPGAIDDAAQSVTLLDDFGGAVVVRVTSPRVSGSGRTQLVVAVRSEQKWLIRDVRDAADQPK